MFDDLWDDDLTERVDLDCLEEGRVEESRMDGDMAPEEEVVAEDGRSGGCVVDSGVCGGSGGNPLFFVPRVRLDA